MVGRKLGMTQIFTATGERIPVTVVEVGPVTVVLARPILPDMAVLTVRSNHPAPRAAVAAMAVAAAWLRWAARAAVRSGLPSLAH